MPPACGQSRQALYSSQFDKRFHSLRQAAAAASIRTYDRGMPKLTKKVKSLFSRRRPVTREDAAEIADWLNEGGALHPDGPPTVIDPKKNKKS